MGMAQLTPFMKQCFLTLGVDLTMICFGCTLYFPAILLPQLENPGSSINPPMRLYGPTLSWLVHVILLGPLCGNFLVPPIMGRLGRKKAHIVVTVMFIIGWLMAALATNVTMLFVFRILHGIAGGLLRPLATVLVAECSSPKNRGAFITTITLSQSAGMLLVHYLGSVLSWQMTSLVCMIFPLISLIMTIFTPESPSWYLSTGNFDEFEKIFRWYRGKEEDKELTSMLRSEIAKKTGAKVSNSCCGNLVDQVTKREFYKPLIIMIHSTITAQFTVGTLISPFIIMIMVGPEANFDLWTLSMEIMALLSNIVAIFAIHKLKRRFMVFFSGGLCLLSHVVLAIYLSGISRGWLKMTPWIPIVFVSVQLFANSVGIVPLTSVISGELLPLKYRSIEGSISSASETLFIFIATMAFASLDEAVELQKTYLICGSIVLYSLIILFFWLPETKGRTLQEIEEDFKEKVSIENPEDNTELSPQ